MQMEGTAQTMVIIRCKLYNRKDVESIFGLRDNLH